MHERLRKVSDKYVVCKSSAVVYSVHLGSQDVIPTTQLAHRVAYLGAE
jgi:hypothetical protein